MSLTRQFMRELGRQEVMRQTNIKFKGLSRRERRKIAKTAHKNSWKARDKEGIERAKLAHDVAAEVYSAT